MKASGIVLNKLKAITLLSAAVMLVAGCASRDIKPGWEYKQYSKLSAITKAEYDKERMGMLPDKYLENRLNRAFFGDTSDIEGGVGKCVADSCTGQSITRAHLVGMVVREQDGLSEKTRRIGKWGETVLGPLGFLGVAGAGAGAVFAVAPDLIAGSGVIGATAIGAGENWASIGLINDLYEGAWLFDCIEQATLQQPSRLEVANKAFAVTQEAYKKAKADKEAAENDKATADAAAKTAKAAVKTAQNGADKTAKTTKAEEAANTAKNAAARVVKATEAYKDAEVAKNVAEVAKKDAEVAKKAAEVAKKAADEVAKKAAETEAGKAKAAGENDDRMKDVFSKQDANLVLNAVNRAYGEIRVAVYGSTLDYENFRKRAMRIHDFVDTEKVLTLTDDERKSLESAGASNKELRHKPTLGTLFGDPTISLASKLDRCTTATVSEGDNDPPAGGAAPETKKETPPPAGGNK